VEVIDTGFILRTTASRAGIDHTVAVAAGHVTDHLAARGIFYLVGVHFWIERCFTEEVAYVGLTCRFTLNAHACRAGFFD
jgi:hypothetical protein